jgi:xanthine dehydrogenase small subunit
MVIEFILNDQLIRTDVEPGLPLLDYIRGNQLLKGTKTGCREGDCGACTVLEGTIEKPGIAYKTVNSCLEPMINVYGKHIVTVEGFDIALLNPVQEALVEHNGTQCGFCTPGFVVALMSYLMSEGENPVESISGNICRCTGYKSIERAVDSISKIKATLSDHSRIDDLIKKGFLPAYFGTIPVRLKNIKDFELTSIEGILIGGGTDLMVQDPENVYRHGVIPIKKKLGHGIDYTDGKVLIGAATSIRDFFDDPLMKKYFPELRQYKPLFASQQIRHMGTIAGNIVNASPIGDLTIILLALNASLELSADNLKTRIVSLKEFYLGYKRTMLKKAELIQKIILNVPDERSGLSFLKVCKRQYLDIASVNSAMGLIMEGKKIVRIDFSVGGVAATPFYATKTVDFLTGETLNTRTILKALETIQEEISPISDIRGTAGYKRLLVRQQFLGHIMKLLPESFGEATVKEILDKSISLYEEH